MKRINPSKLVETQSYLDAVTVENNFLQVKGWVASRNAGPVKGFKISCAGKIVPKFKMTLGLPSPDVKEFFPYLDGGENARFEINIPTDKLDLQQVRDFLIVLTPLFQDGEGSLIMHLLQPSLPLPRPDMLALIGSNPNYFTQPAIEFLGYFMQKAGLQTSDSVLDVGCGLGRMAYSLGCYLAPTSPYEGFDIADELVQWAKENITPRFPNFNFQRVDIYNKMYNPEGKLQATEFLFPYEDRSFNFVFLTSVFTHIIPQEVRHYLDEIHRVLKPGGRCLCTVLLVNEESEKLIGEGKSSAELIHEIDEYWATSLDVPERFIGFREPLFLAWVNDRNFKLVGKYYGNWCGRSEFTSHQDILILEKKTDWEMLLQRAKNKLRKLFSAK